MFSSYTGVGKFGRRGEISASGIVVSKMTLFLNPNSPASYPGSGSTWTDLAGTADNITLVNSPAFTSGSPSYFTFNNASTQYGTGSATNILPSTAYTKSVYFYLNSQTDNNLISSLNGGHYMFFAGGLTLYAGHSNVQPYFGAGAFGSTNTLSLNTWYYAAVTYSTTNGIKLYINGVLNNSNASFTAHTGDGSVNLACFGAGGNLLNGRLGHVFCYRKELSAGEVLQNFNSTKSLYGL